MIKIQYYKENSDESIVSKSKIIQLRADKI